MTKKIIKPIQPPKIFTKDELIDQLKALRKMGWIPNARPGNVGGIGNTLEDFLGIQENNLPIPNAAEWELKCQRLGSSSLTTLFHMEPSPRALRFVPAIFLLKYGWAHQGAGVRYSKAELSFRQTINGSARSDRGFTVVVDRSAKKVLISFDAKAVGERHHDWLESVRLRVGSLGELNPQPYWGFDDLMHKAGTKLLNCFYIQAETRWEGDKEFLRYQKIMILQGFDFGKFLTAMERANILVDFDARTGHNHGTKFRLRQDHLPDLYDSVLNV